MSLDMVRAYDGQFKTLNLIRLATILARLANNQATSAFHAVRRYSQILHHKSLSSVKLLSDLSGLQSAMDQRTRVYLMKKVSLQGNIYSFLKSAL